MSRADGLTPPPPAGGRGIEGSAAEAALLCNSPRPSRRTSRTAFADLPPEPDDPLLGFAPYLHKAPRRNSITPERQRAFIAMLAATGIVTQAARHIGASLEALYRLRGQPGAEHFAAAWEEAIDRGIARLEDCALERAILGEERLVVRGGEVVARWTRHDTGLLMFLLRERRGRRFARGGHFANLVPGHPVYDRLHKAWEEERNARDSIEAEAELQEFCRTLDRMGERRKAADALALEWDNEWDDEDRESNDGSDQANGAGRR